MFVQPMEIEENSNDTSFIDMKRTAIDSSGHLGFFYDACRDCLVEQHNMNHQEESYKTHKTVKGEIKYGNDDKPQNLLRLLSIDEHLILSILLRLTPSTGKASLIDYSHLSNEYTRLFCYSYIDRIQKLPDTIIDIERLMNSPIFSTAATHIITGIEWGHDLVVFLQLPADHHVATQIDNVLNKLLSSLLYENNISSLTQYEESLLENIVHTKVYTNSSELNNLNKVRDVCQYIKENINNISVYPIKYILRPIKYFYPQYNGECVKFTLLSRELNGYIEDYVLQLIIQMKQLEKTIVEDMPKFLCEHLKQQQNNIQIQWLNLKEKIRKEFERLSNLVIQIRNGQAGNLIIEQIFNNNEQMMMNNNVNDLMKNLKNLEEKENFIRYLIQQNFQYLNITEYNINQTDNEKSIQHKLVQNDQHHRILCSNDCLNKDNSEKLHNIICDLVEEAKNNSNIHLIYADFSDCSFQLSSMMVLSSIKDIYEDITHQPSPPLTTTIETSPSSFTQPEVPILPSSDTDISSVTLAVTSMAIDDTINILLLGETGVGKSTFINAFANYLTFNTLEEAEIGQRVVLIPVSFMITMGDNFEEHIVKFGDIDDLNNEDFNHPGQSVTQHCKSYIFNLNDSDRRKLRIIDTPGFGDTRGIEQDDRNMEHILEYLSNFTHLNAICFLLKPNSSRLNIFFRSCLTQLFSLLDRNALNNIIFCFTNSRSTFYTPGDTAPLLKKMLSSLSIGDVPFKKENTFCFDSESFRYLVALQNGIKFNDDEKHEYEMSWSTSVTQSKRLIDYIRRNISIYSIDSNLQSIKHAQFEIIQMIRPILEAMRNILRNLILYKMNSLKTLIELRPKVNDRPSTRCLKCKPSINLVGNFPIAYDRPHVVEKDCSSCDCPLNQHIPMYYMLEYECSRNDWTYSEREMIDLLHELCNASAEFAHFLMHIVCSTKDDPFLIGFVSMIIEENDMCNSQMSNCFNLQLVNDLRNLENKYEHRFNEILNHEKYKKLSDIYTLINTIGKYHIVRDQLAAVKVGQKIMMKQYEYKIS